MGTIAYILPVMQYIIDRVREGRLELGLSQRDVSKILSPDTDSNLLGGIEGLSRNNGYTDHQLNMIAQAFTQRAKQLLSDISEDDIKYLKIKSEYTIYDFYPNVPLSDVPQLKSKIDVPTNTGPSGTINAILETKNFFDQPRTIREVADYCNSFHDKNWKPNNLTSTLDYAVKKGRLKKIELEAGRVLYQKP